MKWSDDQVAAIEGATSSMNRGKSVHPRRLIGSAGTGKTHVLGQIARATVAVTLAPTNKACHVLRDRGVPATTIHSKIYAPLDVSLKEDLKALQEALENVEEESARTPIESEIAEIEEKLSKSQDYRRLSFSFRPDNDLVARNVIVDEASMVGNRVLGDIIRSNPKNILLVGDPAQLPPVKDKATLGAEEPDWVLVTQHRVGDQRDLADLANVARKRGPELALEHACSHSGGCIEVIARGSDGIERKRELMTMAMDGSAIWLCWRNSTRHRINSVIRKRFTDETSPILGDFLVAYKADGSEENRWFNGSEAEVLAVEPRDIPVFDDFTGTPKGKGRAYELSIDGREKESVTVANSDFDEGAVRPTWQYGYCRTVHKAQGSEWDTVVVADENNNMRGDRRAWLYTALTRARKKVVWIR